MRQPGPALCSHPRPLLAVASALRGREPLLAMHRRLFLDGLHRVAMDPCREGVQLTRALGRSAWGISLPRVLRARKASTMAEQTPTFRCDDIPLAAAHRMGCGLRMAPQLSQPLRTRPQSRSERAGRMTIPDGTSPTTMKHRIQRVAAELGIPVTIRRVSGACSSGVRRTASSRRKQSRAGCGPPSGHGTLAKENVAPDVTAAIDKAKLVRANTGGELFSMARWR
jgi:hypothetical protein